MVDRLSLVDTPNYVLVLQRLFSIPMDVLKHMQGILGDDVHLTECVDVHVPFLNRILAHVDIGWTGP